MPSTQSEPKATATRSHRLRGIWPAVLLPWDENWELDEKALLANLDRLLAGKPHGVYTLDTASEFYTLEFDQWRVVFDQVIGHCRRSSEGVSVGVGCTWTNQQGALCRITYARDAGASAIHLSPPYWLPLDEDGVLRFMSAVQEAAGEMPVVLYAPPWGRIRLTAELYERICAVAPCVMGTKTPGDNPALLQIGERHCHYVHETNLLRCARVGVGGCCSALAGLSVAFMRAWWDQMESGRWDESSQTHDRVVRFYEAAVVPCRERGVLAGAIDKALAQLGGAIGSREMRPPYPSVPDDLFQHMERAAHEHLPDAMAEPSA